MEYCHRKNVASLKVSMQSPELITPAQPTPREIKPLSDIDDQDSLRFQVPCLSIYEGSPSVPGKDPVATIRHAIAKALVFYYPYAGRLRELHLQATRKLVVDCTAEGVLFIEADADATLHHIFGDSPPHPPFPDHFLDHLLFNVPASDGILNSPLLLFQVTRLKCGGFIVGTRFNHAMCDAAGISQFMSAVEEISRGAALPSTPPVWERHLLSGRRRPLVSFPHREYDAVVPEITTTCGKGTPDIMVHRSFVFSSADISALRRTLPPQLLRCSRFDIVAACVWRCRTIALSLKPDEETRFMCMMDVRRIMKPPLPVGYYGNAVVIPAVVTTAGELSHNPLEYAVELVRKAKGQATDEYVRSVADLMVARDRPVSLTAAISSYMVSDVTRTSFEHVDFGWGKAVYSSVAKGVADWIPQQLNWYIHFKSKISGEQAGIIVPAYLPLSAMDVFVKQLQIITTAPRTTSAL